MTRIFLNRNVRVNSLISLNEKREREREREKFQSTKLINGNKAFVYVLLKNRDGISNGEEKK
jgi:plasmid replication initiation protein